jgi:hypothetical protein
MNKNLSPRVGFWTLALGVTGFATGFFGPIALNPDANQGPLLGIFITGPSGAILGLVLGVVCKWLPISVSRQWQALIAICVIGGVTVLFFCLPEPQLRGYIVDGTIMRCDAPASRIDAAVEHWQQRIASVTWAAPRSGWKQDAERMLREPGTVIEVRSSRNGELFEHRKPWNRGKLSATWRPDSETKDFFARYAGSNCADYQDKVELLFFKTGQGSKDWPPSDLQNFLGLALIEPLPAQYRSLVD